MATDTSTTNFGLTGFDLIRRLGRGAVFEVAIVRDEHDRELICKRAAHWGVAAGIEREVLALRSLRTPTFPALIATGTDGRGGFLVETRAPGVALRELVADGRAPIDATRWIEVAQTTARALAEVHALSDEKGSLHFVHGDISPDNLFFDAPGTATFIDFSSTTWRDAPNPCFEADRGTVPYAAPEVLRGECHATAESDTYALAATLLALAVAPPLLHATSEAGRLYEAASQGVRCDRLDERADLPAGYRAAIAEALQFDKGRRLSSSSLFAAKLGVSPRG